MFSSKEFKTHEDLVEFLNSESIEKKNIIQIIYIGNCYVLFLDGYLF